MAWRPSSLWVADGHVNDGEHRVTTTDTLDACDRKAQDQGPYLTGTGSDLLEGVIEDGAHQAEDQLDIAVDDICW